MRLAAAGPSFWKAALVGAKTVKSVVSSTVGTSSATFRAAKRAVRSATTAVLEINCGKVKTLSILWIRPPFHGISCEYQHFSL